MTTQLGVQRSVFVYDFEEAGDRVISRNLKFEGGYIYSLYRHFLGGVAIHMLEAQIYI